MKTNLLNVKMELALPVFLGGLSSLVLCAFLAGREPGVENHFPIHSGVLLVQEDFDPEPALPEEAAPDEDAFLLLAKTTEKKRDLLQEMYRKPDAQEWVIDFFRGLCGSREIAEVILACADAFDIAPALAFALSWEESRFNPLAINRKNRDESIDRGLFQLNNRAFPRIELQSFFDPKVNAWYGMGHLRHCLNTGGSEIAALAMYNAGPGKVKTTGAPKTTLDYINRILENRRKIEGRFETRLQRIAEHSGGEKRILVTPEMEIDFLLDEFSKSLAEAEPARPRLVRLVPLSGYLRTK